ncbi:unnamed protein product [Sphagnum troendelagicum]|uniref:DDT domain-containing protein n=1 Tax=Sphagnum troendelagicum TaxID=128251 RepID=A0ABP0U944_9BRYO
MPLYKRKLYTLMKPPKDLKLDEQLFQVRFTKEIFRQYLEYLSCMKLYQRRVWTCKVSGKFNLTYEEAIVSEHKANEKVQQFPKEFMGPVLHMVQFCPLRIDELVDSLYKDFKERFVVGEVVTGTRGEGSSTSTCMCQILKVLKEEGKKDETPRYNVAWLDDNNRKIGISKESADDLKHKRHPFSRALLKAFVRESASSGPSRNSPWSVHDKQAQKYKIPLVAPEWPKLTDTPLKRTPPSERGKHNKVDEMVNEAHTQKKRKHPEGTSARKKADGKRQHVHKAAAAILQRARYPIEDSHVKLSSEDRQLNDRPVPSTDFLLPMACVGDLLMVWDFCSLFSKALLLSPFKLEELEKSLDYKEGEAPLLLEINFALLCITLTDPILRDEFFHRRKHHSKVSSSAIRTQIDNNIEEHQLAMANKCEAEVEELKRKNEERENLKRQQCPGNTNFLAVENGDHQEEKILENGREHRNQEDNGEELDAKEQGHSLENDHLRDWTVKGKRNSFGNLTIVSNGWTEEKENHHSVSVRSRHVLLKEKLAAKLALEEEKEQQRTEEQKKLQEKRKEQAEALTQRKIQQQMLAERLKKQEHLEREMEKHYIRTTPLGKDHFHNCFWFFFREGRLFVESNDCKQWGYYTAKEERSKELAQQYAVEEALVRRSERVHSAPRLTGFLAYVNRLRMP